MMIKLKDVTLKHGSKTALKNVNIELDGKKIYGLLGRNGAGKTSLLSLLASFRRPTSGEITINGEDPFENDSLMEQVSLSYDKDYKRHGVLASHQMTILNYRPNFDLKYAEYLMDVFNLEPRKPIHTFSKGMQSAVSAIVGLASRTPITIFDEVYLGMDAPTRDLFYRELLKDQEEHPRTIILSTHLVSEMEYLFDEIIMLKGGEVLLQEESGVLMERAMNITGNKEIVDEFIQNKNDIHSESLGDTQSVMLYDTLSENDLKIATEKGLNITQVSLHDLFIHLTKEVVFDDWRN